MHDATNSLTGASSAYLRSAMHQPVRWHEWGEEAFAAAQQQNKPILLDVGAVWCHWCHVMDRESYENPEIAEIINRDFIAVKVDRDERPDIDSRHQVAVQAMTGQGGWPLTAFLTPEGKPFYGGTYFPPDDQMGRPGFKRVLTAIAQAFREKQNEVTEQAQLVLSTINQAEIFAGRADRVPGDVVEQIVAHARKLFDAVHGGFGSAPKFPHPAAMDLLIHEYARRGDPELAQIVERTLQGMALGGVYDQLAGGFHRYSVDERWVVPHFEKMSYDNSELLKNYVHAYQATANPFYAAVAKDIVRWMDEWLSDREHAGFYASQDADCSLDDDGDYFTWTLDEARGALEPDEFQVAQLYYDINEAGEMHHNPAKNVLHVRVSIAEIAKQFALTDEQVAALLKGAREKMYAARKQRPTPYVDKTMYVGWNALCVSAYLEAARVLTLKDARHFGLRSLDRILSQGWQEGRLKHVLAYSDPAAISRNVPGVLDDYAFTVLACLDAWETTADLTYFNFARQIAEAMIAHFHDETGGGFFDSESQPGALGALSARRKPFQDSPTPAADSAAALALLRLHAYTNDARYRDMAENTLEVFAAFAGGAGIFAGMYGIAALWLLRPHVQVVVAGDEPRAEMLYAAAIAPFALNKAAMCIATPTAQNLPPALAETIPALPAIREGKTVAVICSNFTCQPPLDDPNELAGTLREALSK